MTALLRAELLKLRTTRTFAAVVASAAALSLTLVVLGTVLGKQTNPHALFTNSAIRRDRGSARFSGTTSVPQSAR